MKESPAICVIVFWLTFCEMRLPSHTVIVDSVVSAVMLPRRTSAGLYLVANRVAAICVLSPHSVAKMSENPVRKGVPIWGSFSLFVSVFCRVSTP